MKQSSLWNISPRLSTICLTNIPYILTVKSPLLDQDKAGDEVCYVIIICIYYVFI